MAVRGIALGLIILFASAAQAQQPASPDALLRRAVGLHQAGDTAAAISAYRAYLKQVPNSVMARSNLGAALARAGRYEEAVAEYEKALKREPGNGPVRMNLALGYYKMARLAEAAAQLKPLVAKEPSNRQTAFLLADCHLRLGENAKVVELLSPLEKESPDDKALLYLLGTALIRDQQTVRGQLLVDRILRDGDSAAARMLLGATKLQVKDFAGALEDLKKAAELDPRLPEVFSYLGMALAATGDTPTAATAFRKELASNPNDYTSNLQLGILLKQEQKYDEARAVFRQALRVRPGNPVVRYHLATLDFLGGRTEAARTQLEQLTKETPGFVEAHVSLATVYYRLKRKEDGDRERAIVLKLNAERQAAEPGVRSK